jgi:hypothetical protein
MRLKPGEASKHRPTICSRAIVAGLLLCLLLLNGVTNLLAQGVRAGLDGQTAATAALAEKCQTHGGDSGPEPQRHDHSHCCICCGASERDLILFVALFTEIAHEQGPAQPGILRTHIASDDVARAPPGWGSAWSSRAPPVLS